MIPKLVCLFVSFFFHPGNHRSSKRFTLSCSHQKGLPNDSAGKESACDAGDTGDFNPCIRKTPWRRKRQPTPGILPGESHGQRSLAGYSPKGRKESDMTEHTRGATKTHKNPHQCREFFLKYSLYLEMLVNVLFSLLVISFYNQNYLLL